jgi:hypothetical protein
LAFVSAGCGTGEPTGSIADGGNAGAGGTSFEGAGGLGGGASPNLDAGNGLDDNPVDLLFADPERNARDFLGPAAAGAQGYSDAAAACYASLDACGASECAAFAACCVNTGLCCAPLQSPSLPSALDFRTCAGQSVAQCAQAAGSDAVAFGQLAPVVTGRGLIPNGTATAEGGAVIGDFVDLSSQRVQLDVRFSLPVGCSGTCLESAGVAFSSTAPGTFVDAEVGLLLSGSREVVNVMIGNAVADSFAAGTDSTQWRLILSPEGSAQVLRDGVSQGTFAFDAAALQEARFVVFGRNLGAASTSAAIASIEVASSFCDNPRSWMSRTSVSVTLDGSDVLGHELGRAPSIVDQAGMLRVAYEVDGEIFVAARQTPAELSLDDLSPALAATEPYEALGIADPELVWDGSFLYLFYTARDGSGTGSIGAAVSTQEPPVFVKRGAPILVPEGEVLSYDAPSALYRDGLWLLIARAKLSNGTTELRAFYASDVETGWARVINGGLEQLTRSDGPASDITDPSLIIHNSAYQLYYARRTGTRWVVELAVSDELLLWRAVGLVLAESGTGFESLGARSPDGLSQPDRVDLVYSGQDGLAFRLGAASRAAPSDTALSIF